MACSNDNGAATRKVTAPLDRAAEGAMTALRGGYTWPSSREVRPSTSSDVWLGGDTSSRLFVDGAQAT
jgi:hypothetical protein